MFTAKVAAIIDRFAPEVRDVLRDVVAASLDQARRDGVDHDYHASAILAPNQTRLVWRGLAQSTRRKMNAEITRDRGADWCSKAKPRDRFEVLAHWLVWLDVTERQSGTKPRRKRTTRQVRPAILETYLAAVV